MASSLTAQAFGKMLLDALHCSRKALGEPSRYDRRLMALFERLWAGTTQGNACIALDAEELRLLQHSDAHSLMGAGLPLILEEKALYLNRFWHVEKRLANSIHLRLERSTRSDSEVVVPAHSRQQVFDQIEAHLKGLAPAQIEAVFAGLSQRLSIIYGGPGTGKTRTIASLMLCFAQLSKRPIWVAAPTAKAGGRLMESLRALLSVENPKSHALTSASTKTALNLPNKALTIQRLLARLPTTEVLFRDLDDPQSRLEAPGLIIIDEASMLSLELCEQVFARVNLDCALVLVGDPAQLHSVETGSVFAALCEAESPALQSARVQLTRNFRQSNRLHLSTLAEHLLLGRVEPKIFGQELVLNPPDLGALIEAAAGRYASSLQDAQVMFNKESSLTQKSLAYLETNTKYRLLSARRTGVAGADRMSELVLYRLKKLLSVSDQIWFEGRIITITKNDPGSSLLNGDIGVCVLADVAINTQLRTSGDADKTSEKSIATELKAFIAFAREATVLLLPVEALPSFQDAYCLSVHQSQGSEFEHVDFIAAPAKHVLATRELLYTAVTRAKSSLGIWGELADLQWAASHPTIRHSRLRWRIEHP